MQRAGQQRSGTERERRRGERGNPTFSSTTWTHPTARPIKAPISGNIRVARARLTAPPECGIGSRVRNVTATRQSSIHSFMW